MTSDFDVRFLVDGDWADWRGLWRQYLDFYDTQLSDAVYESTFARFIDPGRKDMLGWIAHVNGKPAGLVHCIIHAHGWRQEPVTYLQDLFVDPAYRGTGLGRALIQRVYDEADKAGRPGVYWLTQEGNATARKLYDRIGVKSDMIVYRRD